ncbi:MAG: glycerol-3-phosphate 1-O-acyltransferase PlsY [Desulfobacterales bacterium]
MNPVLLTQIAGLSLIAYILGSIPWGIILTRNISEDIRKTGSGNIGATNVRRIAGTRRGALTLLGDMLKGAIPVWLVHLAGRPEICWPDDVVALVAVCAVLGHLYPVFLKFKQGGKGVATAAGCFLAISPLAFLIALVVFIAVIFRTNTMSAGSLSAIMVLPLALLLTSQPRVLSGCAVIIMILITLRHKDNIKRLLNGTEPPIREKRNSDR